MIIHFIWFGSIPHPELVAEIAAKMRYLKSMFKQVPGLKFYVWTTSDLQGVLWSRFTAEHLITPNHRNLLNLEIKDIDELFSMKAPLYPSEIRQLHTLFLREKTGPISNKAVAADIIKFLALLHFRGLYVDAGLLHLNYLLIDKLEEHRHYNDRELVNQKRHEQEVIRRPNHGNRLSKFMTPLMGCVLPRQKKELRAMPLRDSTTELTAISNYGNSLFKKISQYDYALTRYYGGTIDLQIMFFSKNNNARRFLYMFLLNTVNYYCNSEERKKEYDDFRADKVKKPSLRGQSYTSTIYHAVDLAIIAKYKDTKIYYFDLDSKERFKDFPEIYTKIQETQKYENYRTKKYIPQDDNGFASLVFPRGKKK